MQSDSSWHTRLYEVYSTTHAGTAADEASALIFQRDILPNLPSDRDVSILDIGCGQGALVRQLLHAGYSHVRGIDHSAEQVALAHRAGTTVVEQGDFPSLLEASSAVFDIVLATDVLEHLGKAEVVATFDSVRGALRPGGVFIARVPNAVSPFGGNYRHGDFTHETSFTPRSLQQLCASSGFKEWRVLPCPPVAHGVASGLRVAVWRLVSGCMKIALAAETGMLRGHIVTQNMTLIARR